MRLKEYITEVLKIDKKLVNRVTKSNNLYIYRSTETIGEQKLRVKVEMFISKFYKDEERWEIGFDVRGDFSSHFPDTTIKDTIQILNVVVSAVDDFLKTEKPDTFYYIEMTELKGGWKLYQKFKQHILKRYPYKTREDEYKDKDFFLFKRKQ